MDDLIIGASYYNFSKGCGYVVFGGPEVGTSGVNTSFLASMALTVLKLMPKIMVTIWVPLLAESEISMGMGMTI